MEKAESFYGVLPGGRAIIEMAAASGLPMVPEKKRNPLYTTTYGTGELIFDALKSGYRDITVAIGGSATNDGGMGALRALGVKFLDADGNELSGIGEDLEKVEKISMDGLIPEAKEAMENGSILYAGKYSEPDYERIVSEGCGLAIENTMILHSPEVKEKLESFGIPVIVDHSSYEAHPLGRTEWIRLYGVLTGKEKEAEAAFARQEAALQRVTEEGSDAENAGGSVKTEQTAQAEKPSAAFFYITNQGSVNVRRSSDYIPKMIELAGGRYIFSHLGDDGKRSSTVNMQMEEFYAAAKESDYLIYNSTIDGEIHSISELLAKAPVLKDFKAVQAGNVWCTTKNLYQESMSVGAMLEDIHAIFSGSQEDGTYLYKLQS